MADRTFEDRITTYLNSRRSNIESSSIEQVVKDVKQSVFFGMSPVADEEIRKTVSRWAMFNAVGLLVTPPAGSSAGTPAPGRRPAQSDSELVDAVKKAIATINNGVTIGKTGANVKLGVTGLTANLKSGEASVSAGVSWTGTLKLAATSGPVHFQGTLSKDQWELTLSFPQGTYVPDLSSLGKVFSEGERAVGKLVDATRSFTSVSDTGKIGALIKPHAAALQNAVEATRGVAGASEKGGPSFGFKVGSPQPGPGEQGIPNGVEGSVVFTYVF
jgi:hypothetical protein